MYIVNYYMYFTVSYYYSFIRVEALIIMYPLPKVTFVNQFCMALKPHCLTKNNGYNYYNSH